MTIAGRYLAALLMGVAVGCVAGIVLTAAVLAARECLR